MTAEAIATALQGRKSGKGWMARCPAHEDRSPSLSITERDGRILVHCFAGCDQDAVVDALRARGLWPERERPERTPAERANWAQRQRELERVLPDARYWRRAAIAMAEDVLCGLKARLFDPLPIPADLSEPIELPGRHIFDIEQMLTRLRAMDGADLVAYYIDWEREHPGLTWGMVRAARERAQLERAAVSRYVRRLR